MATIKLRIPVSDDPKQEAQKSTPKKVYLKVKKEAPIQRPDISIYDKQVDNDAPQQAAYIKSFFNSYLNSPLYKQRLMKMGYDKPEDAIALRSANLKYTDLKKDYNGQTQYIPSQQKVVINPADLWADQKMNLRSTLAHELSHVAGAVAYGYPKMPFPLTMNIKESSEILSRNKIPKLSSTQLNKMTPEEKIEAFNHDINPNETKADIDTLRYNLFSDGIYDTRTQEFKKEHLQKAKQKYSGDMNLKRLFKNFSDEDIIWIMNNIASNNKADSNLA